MKIPKQIKEQHEKLVELIEQDDRPNLRVEDVAKLCGRDHTVLRMLAEVGRCPFGFGGRENEAANRAVVFPKLAVYGWFTGGAVFEWLEKENRK